MPVHVAEAVSRDWSANHIQHAFLWLSGIVLSLRDAANVGDLFASQYRAKAKEIDIEIGELTRAMRGPSPTVAGDDLSLRLCTLLACVGEPMLADALGVPLIIVHAGGRRMGEVARGLSPAVLAELTQPHTLAAGPSQPI